jgi:hypothetical protein
VGVLNVSGMRTQHTGLQLDGIQFEVSYMEIYKDECYDLFVARESVSLVHPSLVAVC